MDKSNKSLILKGVAWLGGFRGLSRILAVVKTLILARFLTPAQFGIYGISVLVLGFLEVMTETGINVVLIQEEKKTDEYINTAWVVSIARGFIISLFILFSSPLIVSFFNEQRISTLLIIISVIPLIRGFINPSIVKFQKELKFHKEFWFRSSIFFVETLVAIFLGVTTKSESSLIWGMVIAAIFEVAVSFYLVKPRPQIEFNMEKLKKVISSGKWITGAGIFNYIFHHGDDIVVGKLLGTAPLGIYQQAYRISSLPVYEVGETFSKVTFPVYSNISKDTEKLKRVFLKTTLSIALVVLPFGAVLFIFPKEIVTFLLGEPWIGAIPALRVLALYGIIKAVSNSAFSLFLALKKQELVTAITFLSIIGLFATIFPLVNRFGIVGAGMAAILGSLFAAPVVIYYAHKLTRT